MEAGCGTGYWLNWLNKEDRHLTGTDSSLKMLEKAGYAGVSLVLADANQLPFKPETFDLIFCVNAIHHFGDQTDFIKSSYRLLKKGGGLAVVSTDPRYPRHKWYLYDYFEGTYEKDLARLPEWRKLREIFADSGFSNTSTKIAAHVDGDRDCNNVLNDYFLNKDGSSTLAVLSTSEYSKGLAKIKKEIEASRKMNRQTVFPVQIYFGLTSGIKL